MMTWEVQTGREGDVSMNIETKARDIHLPKQQVMHNHTDLLKNVSHLEKKILAHET